MLRNMGVLGVRGEEWGGWHDDGVRIDVLPPRALDGVGAMGVEGAGEG